MSVVARDSNGRELGQIVPRLGQTTYLVVETTSQQSHAFPEGVTLIRVASELDGQHVHFEIGVDPIATTDVSPVFPSGHVEYFSVLPGEKIAFIQGHSQSVHISVTDVL